MWDSTYLLSCRQIWKQAYCFKHLLSDSFSLPPPSLLRSMEDSVLFLGPTLAECLRVLEWKAETRGTEGRRKGGRNTLRNAPFSPPELSISSLLPVEVHSFSYANPRWKCSSEPFCVFWLSNMFRGCKKNSLRGHSHKQNTSIVFLCKHALYGCLNSVIVLNEVYFPWEFTFIRYEWI